MKRSNDVVLPLSTSPKESCNRNESLKVIHVHHCVLDVTIRELESNHDSLKSLGLTRQLQHSIIFDNVTQKGLNFRCFECNTHRDMIQVIGQTCYNDIHVMKFENENERNENERRMQIMPKAQIFFSTKSFLRQSSCFV